MLFVATLLVGFSPSPGLADTLEQDRRVVQMTTRQFMALPKSAFASLAPRLIVSPLIAESFDALELATKLQEFGYQGRYRVVAKEVPNPELVAREIRFVAPAINFAIAGLKVTGPAPSDVA